MVAISVDIVENCSVSGLRKIDGPVNFVEDAPWTNKTNRRTVERREVRRSNVQKYSTFV